MRAQAPGRVNLIGDHTDYTGGFVLPMAVDLGTVVEIEPGGDVVELHSDVDPDPAVVPIGLTDPASVPEGWGRYVAGVVAVVGPVLGGRGTVTTTLPLGAGLSSSAALVVAVALALGFDGSPLELALACQRAEYLASGVPSGVMDQLASAAGQESHALLIDCRSLDVTPVPLPDDVDVVVVHSGQSRTLVGSPYADRRAQCEAAARIVGPLRDASLEDVNRVPEQGLRRRARHVVTENGRVLQFADALRDGDLRAAGALMIESHRSLRDDFEVSTPALDALVEHLAVQPGVHGARLTGAGFGGCAVALAEPGAVSQGRRVRASSGASRLP